MGPAGKVQGKGFEVFWSLLASISEYQRFPFLSTLRAQVFFRAVLPPFFALELAKDPLQQFLGEPLVFGFVHLK